MNNKVRMLQTLFMLRTNREGVMGDHVSHLESRFSRPLVMGINLEKELELALLYLTISNLVEYQTTITTINDLPEQTTIWDYVTTLFIEEAKRMAQKTEGISTITEVRYGMIASSTTAHDSHHPNLIKESDKMPTVTCYNCFKVGHMSRNCRASRSTKSNQS